MMAAGEVASAVAAALRSADAAAARDALASLPLAVKVRAPAQ